MGDASQYPPQKIALPPNLADTPRTRRDFGRYLAEITYMDGQVGEILATLKSSDMENNTLVLFTSEQGSQFPGNKFQKYLMGTQGSGDLNNPYWGTWIFSAAAKPKSYELVKRYMVRPAEELYDSAADPYEMNNLAANPNLADIKARLSAELDRWMAEQGDPGIRLDTPEGYCPQR